MWFLLLFPLCALASSDPLDTEVLKPNCEEIWDSNGARPTLSYFKYPSNRTIHASVYCVPTEWYSFSQSSISNKSSSGKDLKDRIAKFRRKGFYSKKKLPDVVRWNENTWVSLDNRRIYCAKEAGIRFVPGRIHNPEELLPNDWIGRFSLSLQSPWFQGKRVAQTYGEAVLYRCLSTAPNFPIFGTKQLPQVRGKTAST